MNEKEKPKIKVRTYLETFYGDYKSSIKEVEDRSVLEVDQDENAIGFRFFDISEIKVDEKVLTGVPENISDCIYFGTRYDRASLYKMYENDCTKFEFLCDVHNNIEDTGLCLCRDGKWVFLYGDMTYEEALKEELKKTLNRIKCQEMCKIKKRKNY